MIHIVKAGQIADLRLPSDHIYDKSSPDETGRSDLLAGLRA